MVLDDHNVTRSKVGSQRPAGIRDEQDLYANCVKDADMKRYLCVHTYTTQSFHKAGQQYVTYSYKECDKNVIFKRTISCACVLLFHRRSLVDAAFIACMHCWYVRAASNSSMHVTASEMMSVLCSVQSVLQIFTGRVNIRLSMAVYGIQNSSRINIRTS